LSLELFDDNSNDDFPNEEWIGRRQDEDGRWRKLYGKVLIREDGFYNWKYAEIKSYNK
jgi:dynein heavy chain